MAMRPSRLVLFSAALMVSTASATPGVARSLFPGMLFGAVGSILPHPHFGHRHMARHHAAPRHEMSREAKHEPNRGPNQANARSASGEQPAPTTANEPARETQHAASGVFWPQLGDDLFDYVLWPTGNDDRFWAYGYNDIVMTALRPDAGEAPRMAALRHELGAKPAPATTTGTANEPANENVAEACASPQGGESADSLISRLESTIRPTDAQRPALADLKTAFARALDYIDKSCAKSRPQTPTARLGAMEDRIWAARQALLDTRAPLAKLYDQLSDEQKARLNGPSGRSIARAAGCTESNPDLARMLGGRAPPDPKQRPALEALRTTSTGLSKLLAASCPATMPASPIERLDVADHRLNSMLYAAVTLRAPLDAIPTETEGTTEPGSRVSGLERRR
jgi:hypothetical protein